MGIHFKETIRKMSKFVVGIITASIFWIIIFLGPLFIFSTPQCVDPNKLSQENENRYRDFDRLSEFIKKYENRTQIIVPEEDIEFALEAQNKSFDELSTEEIAILEVHGKRLHNWKLQRDPDYSNAYYTVLRMVQSKGRD